MFRKIDETIHYHLETALGITASRDGEEKCRELMEEDATMGERRRRLKDEKNKLADFAKELNRLVNQIDEIDFKQMQNGHRGNSNDSERSGVHGESMDLDGNENGRPSAYSNDLPGPDGELF
jgi:predicted nuclease with TOPRIM domain